MPGTRAAIAKPAAAGGAPKTLTYLQHNGVESAVTTYTFTGENLGTASAGRFIIAAISGRASGTPEVTISSVTIGGVTATQLALLSTTTSGASTVALFVAAVPTGTTGNVVITFSRSLLRCGVDLWSATGITTIPLDTDSTQAQPAVMTVDTTASGIVVAVAVEGTIGASFTWTNATERFDGVIAASNPSSRPVSTADASTSAGTLTVTATGTGATQPTAVAASW